MPASLQLEPDPTQSCLRVWALVASSPQRAQAEPQPRAHSLQAKTPRREARGRGTGRERFDLVSSGLPRFHSLAWSACRSPPSPAGWRRPEGS